MNVSAAEHGAPAPRTSSQHNAHGAPRPTAGSTPPANGSTDRAERAATRLAEICRGLQVDRRIALDFIADYLRMLTPRLERIERDLAGTDDEETIVALLSIASSSTMVGAVELAELARQMRVGLEHHTLRADQIDLTPLRAEIERTRSELTEIQAVATRTA